MWPAGAFEIRDDRVTWRPAIDLTRVLVMALVLAIAVVRARGGAASGRYGAPAAPRRRRG